MMHYYLLTEAQEMLQRYYASIACSLLTDMLDVPYVMMKEDYPGS